MFKSLSFVLSSRILSSDLIQVFFAKESVVASGDPTRNFGERSAEKQAALNPPVVPTVSEAIALPCTQSRHFPCAWMCLDVGC